jgi:hypothetical protein
MQCEELRRYNHAFYLTIELVLSGELYLLKWDSGNQITVYKNSIYCGTNTSKKHQLHVTILMSFLTLDLKYDLTCWHKRITSTV